MNGDNTLGSILTASSESGQLVNYTYSDTIEQEVLTSNFGNGQSIVYEYNDDREITAIKLGEETKYGYEYLETTDEYGDVTEEWTELTDYVSGLKKIIEDSKTTVNDLNGNFIYSVEDVSDDFDGKKITIGSEIYTLVTEENKDTFKTNGTTDFEKTYTYSENNDLTKVETAGLTTSYSYNTDKFISVLENTLNDISKAYGYTYDDNGNITTETVTTKDANGNVVASETITYAYDDKEQLTSAETSTTRWNYSYDNRGNILSKSKTDLTTNTTVTDTYVYDETWKDKLINYNGQSITYDASGNPTSYLGNTLTWSTGRQLASFNDIEFTYDENGIRTSKTVASVKTEVYLDGANIIEQRTGNDFIHFYYDSSDEVVGFKYNNSNYFYVKNMQGDITDIVNASGEVISSYSYDPWGDVLSISGDATIGNLNPFRYRSYYYDSEIGLYYLQSRYYDPEVGRFINCDDAKFIGYSEDFVSYNPFAYCENEPVYRADNTGTCFLNSEGDICHDNWEYSTKYNAEKAIAYAKKWWDQRNKSYYKYNGNGDCANFVSQCLYAGGKMMNNTWHSFCSSKKPSRKRKDYKKWNYDYKKLPLRCYRVSNAWSTAKGLYKYLKKYYSYNTYKNVDSLKKDIKTKKIKVGDVAFFKNSTGVHHAVIVGRIVNTSNKRECYYYAHTRDRNATDNDSSFSEVLKKEHIIVFSIK